jgi:hypothetical protein
VKYTRFLADNILSKYNLPDRRGSDTYAFWENHANWYNREMKNQALRETENMFDYIELLKGDMYYTVVTSVKGDFASRPERADDILRVYGGFGIEADNLTGTWIIGGEAVARELLPDSKRPFIEFGYDTISIDGNADLFYNGKPIAMAYDGLTVAVYDNFNKTYVEDASFDAYDFGFSRRETP